MGGKDRHRRGGMAYGGGFGFPSIDGHIPHQYRHPGSSTAPSPYPVDYGSGAGSGGGAGAFSPSHQYSLGQNPAMQSVPGSQMQHRQHGQTFPSVHHGQQHRNYPNSGHRMTPQYPHYSPQGAASTGSSGMYSPPPQRYLDGAAGAGFDPKVSSSPGISSSSNSVAANNVGPMDNVPASYQASGYPGYSPQTQSLHKQAALQHRNSQHNLGIGYDNSLKMQHQAPPPGSVYTKHQQPSNPSLPQLASQEISKSPMHPNAQQTQIHQNFSPISNPSPAASAMHSPSCSSSPSPLMGVSEVQGNASGHGLTHPPMSNPRNSHAHGRLLQTMPQLSPTPNSNSSISSCGSSSSQKALGTAGGGSLPATGRNKVGLVTGTGSRDESSSLYSSLDKMQDAGLNSLNALSSQVANLPNTVQHMLLTDTVLSQKKKDGVGLQQGAPGVVLPQPRSRNVSAASSTSTTKEGGADEESSLISVGDLSGTKVEREEQLSEGEHGRVRQMSGASSGSEPAGCQPSTGLVSKTTTSDSPPKELISEAKGKEAHIPPSSSSPSFRCQSLQTGPASYSAPPVSSSTLLPPHPNCVPEAALTYEHKSGQKKPVIKNESEGAAEKLERGSSHMQQDGKFNPQNGQDKENRLHTGSRLHHSEGEGKPPPEEQQNPPSIGVIVSTRSDGSHAEKSSVEGKPPHSYLKESSSYNGEEGVNLTLYSSQHHKSNFGRLQSPTQSGPQKYGYSESTYGSDLSMKTKGRAPPLGVVESNPRYLGYQHSQTAYGSLHPKDPTFVAEPLVKRGQVGGAKGHEENSQMQQFPSLLQEVLQGYNLDRRYGRQEQAFSAHLQVQQHLQSRHPYGAADTMRLQGGVTEAPIPDKTPSHRHGSEPDFTDSQSSLKTDLSNAKTLRNPEKAEPGGSQSLLPPESQQSLTKHINLTDYSLPQRKAPSRGSTPSSAVQELLLQEPEPLTGPTEAQKSSGFIFGPSERRSVICDVSPNRRTPPEREREAEREKVLSSVIQQSFTSAAASDTAKKDVGEKHVMKMEMVSKETVPDAANVHGEHQGVGPQDSDLEYQSKSGHSSVVMSAEQYRRGHVDISSLSSHPMSTNPLSPPPRSYLHGVDLSAGGSAAFPAYRYGDTREGSIMSRSNPHFPYHSVPPQAQTTNRLQMYPHSRAPPHHPHDMSEWVKAMSRPSKEVMMQPNSSPGRHKISQSEQRPRMMELSADQHPTKAPLPHQGSYYDMKMWESAHPGRESTRLIEGESYYRTPPTPTHPSIPTSSVLPLLPHAKSYAEPEALRGAPEETKHPCPPPPPPPPPPSSVKPPANMNSAQVQRTTKTGGSGDTNPLISRRRVRSFISPIPAKRLVHDASVRTTNSHPGNQLESSHHNEEESSSDGPCPRLSSPLPRESSYSQPLSPASSSTSLLPTRKGRGLKLEAIVQKITPNLKKPTGPAGEESVPYSGFSHPEIPGFSDPQDQDLAHFSRVSGGDDAYMDDSHSLNDLIPFRGVDDAGPLPPSAYPCDPHHTSEALKQKDFDFGLGAAVASVSGDKEDFTLLGPLPPPPPLPRPVQGSPPPSSSALSDIQQFTNTYQQLETRRGEQSAANLLRQKLQESGIGFDDYPGSDYYGTTPPHHSQTPGHLLSRHHMSSARSSLSPQDSKSLDNMVPKGYFPSGKKKGRPVGSVNKQKRAQNQVPTPAPAQPVQTQSADLIASVAPPISAAPAATTPTTTDQTSTRTSAATTPPLLENMDTPPLAPPILTQVVKVDGENEDVQSETAIKPARRRRRGVKHEDLPLEARGRQRRRRRGPAAAPPSMAKEDPDAPLGVGGTLGTNRAFGDPNRRGPFVPHIHVENKVPEIGAVCTIVNAEEDKMKGERSTGGGKVGGVESLLTPALCSQLSRKDRESENRETDEVETRLQSGKALPSSDYVVPGPVVTETNHSGRLLCCLCQKWANYKHLGDLYGPFYPAEYAAKLPKNQPPVRQGQTPTGTNRTGPNFDPGSNTFQDAPPARPPTHSDYMVSLDSNMATAPSAAGRTSWPAGREEVMMMMPMAGQFSTNTPSSSWSSTALPTSLSWDLDLPPIPELKREPDLDLDLEPDLEPEQQQKQPPADGAQQRPPHRKLTSHPRFKRRHKSSDDSPRMVPSNSKASLPFQPPPPALDSLGPLAQLAQLPQMPMDPEELWVHEGCMVWTSGVYLVNGRLYGLQEALDGARETCCSYCQMVGSTLGCYTKGCTLRYHHLCALEADCSLNEDNFSLRCPKHKFSIRPVKPVLVEQSERG